MDPVAPSRWRVDDLTAMRHPPIGESEYVGDAREISDKVWLREA